MMTSAVIYKITYIIYYISSHSNHLTLFKVLYTIFWKKLMLVVYLIYEIMYIFLSLAIVQGGLQAMVTRWAYSLICPIRGCAAGQSMVFVLSVLDRDYDFVRVFPIYKHGCPIYLIGLQNFFVFQVYTKAITLRWFCSIAIANKMVFTLHEKTDLLL